MARPAPGRSRDLSELDDDALARRAGLGEREAFDEIVQRHGPAMYRFALRMLGGNDSDAADAVQEAFISAWRSIGQFQSRSALRTWLMSLVKRRAVDLQRRRKPTPVGDDVLATLMPELDDHVSSTSAGNELVRALQQALDDMPVQQRTVWLLREIEQMSYSEIADTVGVTSASVRGQLHRARITLAERMAAWS